jgi:hypothetical protein
VPDLDLIAERDGKIASDQPLAPAVGNATKPARRAEHERRGRRFFCEYGFLFSRQELLEALLAVAMPQIGKAAFFLPVHCCLFLVWGMQRPARRCANAGETVPGKSAERRRGAHELNSHRQ